MKKLSLFLKLFLFLLSSILLSQEYEIYVSSGTGAFSTVKKYNLNGDFLGDLVSFGAGGLNWPQDIIFLEDDDIVLVSGLNSNAIHKYNATTGADEGIWANVPAPTRMKIGDDNLLYVLQWGANSKVLRFQLDGTPLGEYTNTGINQCIGIDWDSSNNLYVSSFGGGSVTKFNTSGQSQGSFITGLSGPTNIWQDPNNSGDFLVNQWSGNKVSRYDSNGNFIEDIIPNITQPEGYAYLPNGNLLIGSGGGADKIIEYQSNGTPIGDFTTGNGLANPNAIYVREVPTASIQENNFNETFVTPTIGNQFLFNSKIISKYKSLEVYNVSGELVDTLIPKDNYTIWDASKHSEGLYFISSSIDRKRAIQKIIIKK